MCVLQCVSTVCEAQAVLFEFLKIKYFDIKAVYHTLFVMVLYRYDEAVRSAVTDYESHRLVRYLFDLW